MEILNTTEILKTRNDGLVIVFIIMVMALLGIMITLVSCVRVSNGMFITWVICMVVCVAAAKWFAIKVPAGIYQYEVLLTDDYSATQLLQDYDVVEQRGTIWVIQDKEKTMDENEEYGCYGDDTTDNDEEDGI